MKYKIGDLVRVEKHFAIDSNYWISDPGVVVGCVEVSPPQLAEDMETIIEKQTRYTYVIYNFNSRCQIYRDEACISKM